MSDFGQDRVPRGLALITKGESAEIVLEWLELAKRTGFEEVQLQTCWHPILDEELSAIARHLRALDLRCRSIGVYNDFLRLDSYHFFDTSGRELEQIVRWMPAVGMREVVVWSGSYAEGLLDDDPRNHGVEARAGLERNLRGLLPLLERGGVHLLFEPWRTHALATPDELESFCRTAPGRLGVVLDAANFIDPDEWADRAATVRTAVDTLSTITGIVHLKDMTVDRHGGFDLPYAGKGGIDFSGLLDALEPLWRRVPFVVEHVNDEAEIREATRFLIRGLAEAGYPLD